MNTRTGRSNATILGSYRDVETGTHALRAIRAAGFHRSVGLHRDRAGRSRVFYDVTPAWLGALAGAILALVGLAAVFASDLQVPAPGLEPGNPWIAFYRVLPLLLGALIGVGVGRLVATRLVGDAVSAYGRWVLPGEMLVLVQAQARSAEPVLSLMRRVERGQPATFVIRAPDPRLQQTGEPLPRERLKTERLRQHASRLAAAHVVGPDPRRTRRLMDKAREVRRVVEVVSGYLTEGASLGQNISVAAEWLLDNSYIVQRHIGDVLDNLSPGFYEVLPLLENHDRRGTPRVYDLARELVIHTDSEIYEEDIDNALSAYQEVAPLLMAELWAMPLMVRLVLVENLSVLARTIAWRQYQHERADFWANRLLNATRRAPDHLLSMIAQFAQEQPDVGPYFADRLLSQLQGEPAALEPVRAWLERKWNAPVSEVLQEEQRRQAEFQVTIASTIGSLRRLSHLDWRDTFERVSLVDAILRTDPSGVYERMDFDTRNRYRRAVETIARGSSVSELEVARTAVEAAGAAPDSSRGRHVGYFLVDAGRQELEGTVLYHSSLPERLRGWVTTHPAFVYAGAVALLTVAAMAVALWAATVAVPTVPQPLALLLVALLALFPASEVAVQTINFLVTLALPPQSLPKLSFEEGIPPEFKSLVVVPVLLQSPASVRADLERLETRFLANRDDNLRYALLADFPDAPARELPGDDELLAMATEGTAELNMRHGTEQFSLFYRTRVWSSTEQCWMGWERKRGKLEELNRWLLRLERPDYPKDEADTLRHVGDSAQMRGIRFVITLDADTQLPYGTARQLAGTIAHPLNRPHLSPSGETVERGYAIIQPRISTCLPSATATRFSRLFSDPTGIDPYTHVVSDVYQDLAGESSYLGKGIYDVEMFDRVLRGRFPDGTILSHDLIEGAHLRAGLASDIELLDDFPSSYLAYSVRQHRWIRGDWQIADWVLPSVPAGGGGRRANPLNPMNRWKILDNLRRSLVAPAAVGLLVVGWLAFPRSAWIWSLLVGLAMFLPALLGLASWIASEGPSALLNREGWRQTAPGWVRAVLYVATLPHQAALSLDAIVRVLYRRTVSRRRLLEWQTAQIVDETAREAEQRLAWRVVLISLFSFLILLIVASLDLAALGAALPFLVLWLFFPAIVIWLRGGRKPRPVDAISDSDRLMLRRIARRTWRYFDEFVGRRTNWLPPDNFQESLRTEVAERTSPTNIGLWLVATAAAHDFGYITIDQLVQRNLSTIETLGKLERYEGHLLNWYNTRNLEPLYPRYVSTVDSGNLLVALWTLVQCYDDALSRPLLGAEALQGLADTMALALLNDKSVRDFTAGENGGRVSYLSTTLNALFADPPDRLDGLVGRVRAAAEVADELAQSVRAIHPYLRGPDEADDEDDEPAGRRSLAQEEGAYWISQVERQLARWVEIVERYLPWVERLSAMPADYGRFLGEEALSWRERALEEAPSLFALGTGKQLPIREFLAAASRAGELPDEVDAWLRDLRDTVSYGQWLAGEMLGRAERVLSEVTGLAAGMDMGFLYDEERKLFSIGYNVSELRLDSSYYDLLASEARLASYAAIARGDVPVDHWFALGRPYGKAGGRRVLLSWSGTMFEYLMPVLFTRSFENSLLDAACRAAVWWQIEYARRRGIPWGMSEAAFSALDAHRIYQYQAFGVPGLALKRGVEDDLVVAPYASALALSMAPRDAVRNLDRLARLGAIGRYGYYDAVDYTRRRRAERESGVIVRTYMAHHQGMILMALSNFLRDGAIRERFHDDPRVRAAEPLLFERIPAAPPIIAGTTRSEAPPRLPPPSVGEVRRGFTTPHSRVPRTQLLGSQGYSVMVTNSGGGYSRWGGVDVTRWRADTTGDPWGSWVYLRDSEDGSVWSAGYHPVGRESEDYLVNFTSNSAHFARRDGDVGTEMDIVVSAEDDVEIRRLTLVNYSSRARVVEVTSYAELALAPHEAERAHPAFSNMFVETEAAVEIPALLARRRPRSAGDEEMWAVHVLAMAPAGDGEERRETQYETDRGRFVGRGRSVRNPAALDGDLTGATGYVLDPVFSLRQWVRLGPGERGQIAFVTGMAKTRERALELADKYNDLRAVRRAFQMAESQSTLLARHLRVSPEDLQRYQQLASHMLYPNPRFRAPASVLRRNRRGQSGLWGHGVSGDLPVILVMIGSQRDMPLVREVLLAHTFWRLKGFKCDLVIVDEEAAGYEQPLRDSLRKLIQAHSQYTGENVPGGSFLIAAKQLPPDELDLLLTVARVVLVAARGPLAQQLTAVTEVARPPLPLPPGRRMAEEPSPPLPFMELPYFNGVGGFTPDGREYAIYLGPGTVTPAPWVNVMANPSFGSLVSESGGGFSWYGNSQSNRLLPWSNDPVSDPVGEAIYIRDVDLGIDWTPTPSPIRELDAYRARHGQGYTVFEHNSHAIEQEMVSFVPMDEAGGAPVKVNRLVLRNRSGRRRVLRVTYYVEWVLGTSREETQMHVVTSWDGEARAVLARNFYHPHFPGRVAFASSGVLPASYTADRTEFLGRNGSVARPAGLSARSLSRRVGAGLDPCAAIQVSVEIEPWREAEVVFLHGEAADPGEVRRLCDRFRDSARVGDALKETSEWWDRLLGTVQVQTPVLGVNFLLNRWLLYQALSCRIWGRSAFYQSGGAIGFRDQLQDCLALVYSAPRIARRQILAAAAHQFAEGDVQHWWHPESGAGVRTRISDDLLWLPYAVGHYVRVTGDEAILGEKVTFLVGPELGEGEHERYFAPEVSANAETLLEHCRRAIRRGLTSGPHGLPLMGTGDWNDGMNRVGEGGRGESVWLAWFLVEVLNGFADLVEGLGEAEEAAAYRAEARRLAGAVESEAWDGDWYLRAYFDDGSPLGSRANLEARIDSLPQSWGVISGAADPARAALALNSAESHLVRWEDKMALLFTPPFGSSATESGSMPDPGYIAAYPPGVRENGGQYTHGALWLAMAFARRGEGDRAGRLLEALSPVEHARTPEDVERYRVEPYVVAADVYALAGNVGRGGWTWYTGSAGWMYRVWLEEVLGFRLRGSSLVIDPVIPSTWDGFELRYRYGRTEYSIRVENQEGVCRGVTSVEVDGQVAESGEVNLVDDRRRHEVVVRLGHGA